MTTTDAATVYIENSPANGTNQTITNPYALWVDEGESRFDANVGIKKDNPAYSLDINATDAIQLPIGTTGDRPTPNTGLLRYSATNQDMEVYSGTGSWNAVLSQNNHAVQLGGFGNVYTDTASITTLPGIDHYAICNTGTSDILLTIPNPSLDHLGKSITFIRYETAAGNNDLRVTTSSGGATSFIRDIAEGQTLELLHNGVTQKTIICLATSTGGAYKWIVKSH